MSTIGTISYQNDSDSEEEVTSVHRVPSSSTNGTILYQKDDGENEVTSGILKQPSFRIIKRPNPLLRPVSAPSDSVRKTSPKQKQALFEELNKFNEIKKETENENTFARENNLDSIYWCWNCQHSECDQH